MGLWTQARRGFCPQVAGLQPALEAWLVLGCVSDPVTPISWKGQGSAVTKTFFHPALFHQDLRSLTISKDSYPTPRTLFLKSRTQKLKTSPGLCADGSCGVLVGMACEKKVASHWRPVCPEDPWTEMGKAGGLPLPPPSPSVTAQTMAPLSSLHVLSVGRELLFSGLVTIFPCLTVPIRLLGLGGSLLPYRGPSVFFL